MTKTITFSKKIDSTYSGLRLDSVIAKLCPEFSRNHIKNWILDGSLVLDGKETKPRKIIQGGELVEINVQEEIPDQFQPQNINLSIIWEDESVLVVNKPPGLVVHPGAGNKSGTLLNALLYYEKDLGYLPRAGIVHRLDKDTSGIMVVAKTERAYLNLVNQLKDRTVKREYWAIVVGVPISGGIIEEPVGRHPKLRKKQAVTLSGKPAITEYRVHKKLGGYTLLKAYLRTGRTHQIRVHLAFKNFPIVGDNLYGARKRLASGTTEKQRSVIESFNRQALHAKSLSFKHPVSNTIINLETELPKDFKYLIQCLEEN